MDQSVSPIICTLTRDEILARKASLLPGLAARASEHGLTADGFRLRFDATPGIIPMIAEVVENERQCCRFLQFDLRVTPDGGAIDLILSGPDGTLAFLEALFAT